MKCIILICLIGLVLGQGPVDPETVPCGVPTVQPATSRIVGGKVATPGSWPWMVLIVDNDGYIAGSGSIIHPHVILTSAQHFENALMLNAWELYAGEYNINVDDPNEKTYHIARAVVHPGYNSSTLENDAALVITREPIQFNDHTRAACLPDATHTYTVGETCYLPGWGSTANTGNEEVMNQVDLPILADTVCAQHWSDFLPSTELCAGYEDGGKDFCGDDIGSPLMCKDAGGAWYIQGIASSGGDCTLADEPGIFEDVSMYSDWIKSTMAASGYTYMY